MTMISLGGVIGAGLFIASGPAINGVEPAAILTYALTGILLVLIMRMLGRMVVAWPSVGSFSDYSRMALGDWAGFPIGWLYWYFWVTWLESRLSPGQVSWPSIRPGCRRGCVAQSLWQQRHEPHRGDREQRTREVVA
jgi:amino acid permease